MPADAHSDMLFGKIALNWRLISRDLLNRALHYQRTQDPNKQLGEILLEKGVLTREQVNEILAYQERINAIRTSGVQPGGRPDPAAVSGAGVGGGVSNSVTGSWRGPTSLQQPAPAQPDAAYGMTATVLGASPTPDQDALVGATVGGCVISAKIGAGGMGAIYLAHHEALRKDVVVKILPPESACNPRTVERFFREARAAAKLEHPNVVSVQDVGTTDQGLHFIIMQYIDGRNLEEKIRGDGRHTPADALKIVLQVARGLHAAHQAGVIHRDIKAENILVTTGGQVKVTDFGLAKDLNSELKLTADGAMIGTPLYMAPEIGRVKEIDGRVDIYSLGVTFYYLLTGIQPFRGFSALEILSAKAHDKLKPPELHNAELPEPFRNVVGMMLEKDREARYRDVEHLIRDLEALDRGFPVEAGVPTIWPPRGGKGARAGKGSKRKATAAGGGRPSGLVIAAFVGAALLAIVLVVALVFVLLS